MTDSTRKTTSSAEEKNATGIVALVHGIIAMVRVAPARIAAIFLGRHKVRYIVGISCVVAAVVLLLVLWVLLPGGSGSGSGSGSDSGSTPGAVDSGPPPAPTPIPVQTVLPGPAPTQAVQVPPMTETIATAGPNEDVTDKGVTVRLVSLRPIQTQGYARGEATGDGLAVTIVVTNVSDKDLPLLADVGLFYGPHSAPGMLQALDGHNSPFGKQTLAPGESAERTVAFAAPNKAGTPVAVQVLVGDGSFVIQATVGS
ncbi:MAG: hypothetical protein FWF02_10920 [Micrococcales bacterium]|nr:hypothetical protein [Micrococcales bacterium]MCL2668198.1 hypothetical protein [Micrococcales bacterium]